MPKKKESKPKMKWRPAPDELVLKFEKAIESFPEAEKRKMFGYPCSFINGQMFTGLHQENMILRLGEDERTKLLKLKGTKPFEPMPGRVMREYVVVPESILNSKKKLHVWLEKSLIYAKSLPPKKPKKKKKLK